MDDQTRKLRERQNCEAEAADLGAERSGVEEVLLQNSEAIAELMPKALAVGIPLDTFAQLVRVSRQTLYRWRDSPPQSD